jgi:alanine racemase
MLKVLRALFHKKFTPLNLITINSQSLIGNYKKLSAVNPKVKVAPVFKSNAYGHGIRLAGQILDKVGAPFLCVDSLYEAFQLKSNAKVKTPILIMGYIHQKSLAVKKLPFSFAIYDLIHAQVLDRYQKGAKVHIFVDTGMHREGVVMDELPEYLEELKKLKNIEVEGLMTHLADLPNPDSEATKFQIENFKKAKKMVLEAGFKPKWFHLGGIYALVKDFEDCNMTRVGKAVYGIDDADSKPFNLGIKPALRLTTTIVQIKQVKKGEKVGYSGTYAAPKDITLGILPLGYNDGVDRRLSGKGVVMVGEAKCPIIGLISMNITAIDISAVKEPFLGMQAVIFSDNPQDPNSVVNSSKAGGILPHEMLIHIAESTKRVVV